MIGGGTMQLPELRELQKDVIAVERRDDQPGRAVANAAARDVVAKKRERRMAGELQDSGAPPRLVHLFRRVRRVSIDSLEMFRDVAVRVVLQLAAQLTDVAARGDRLVHVLSRPL